MYFDEILNMDHSQLEKVIIKGCVIIIHFVSGNVLEANTKSHKLAEDFQVQFRKVLRPDQIEVL
jgi:hypothetical protein